MRKTQIPINKQVYWGLSILELSKIVMYEFCYDYVKTKTISYGYRCYVSYVYKKTNETYKDIV